MFRSRARDTWALSMRRTPGSGQGRFRRSCATPLRRRATAGEGSSLPAAACHPRQARGRARGCSAGPKEWAGPRPASPRPRLPNQRRRRAGRNGARDARRGARSTDCGWPRRGEPPREIAADRRDGRAGDMRIGASEHDLTDDHRQPSRHWHGTIPARASRSPWRRNLSSTCPCWSWSSLSSFQPTKCLDARRCQGSVTLSYMQCNMDKPVSAVNDSIPARQRLN